MKILPTLGLPSYKSSIHDNDSHIVRFLRSCVAQMLSCSVTCYVLQRNTASILNIGFNYVFVSVREVAEPFRTALICSYGQKAFINGTWYAATEKIQKWCAESKRLGTPGIDHS